MPSAKFGWDSLDALLGEEAVYPRDVIVLKGPEGTLKTQIGLLFLLDSDPVSTPGITGCKRSLILPARDEPSTVAHMLRQRFVAFHRAHWSRPGTLCKRDDQIIITEVPGGFVYPGRVLQSLEDEFEKARAVGDVIDRVMIDDVAHWELACPFVREDQTFGDTLTRLLRRYTPRGLK